MRPDNNIQDPNIGARTDLQAAPPKDDRRPTSQLPIDYQEREAQIAFARTPIGQAVKQFEMQQRIATMFSKSQIVPQQYRGNVADCVIAIDMAMRMNCNPLTVMQNLVVVQGRPTWQSQFLIACINQSGRFTTMQFRQWQDGMVGRLEYEDNEWDPVARKNNLVRRTFDGAQVPNLCCQAFATDKTTGEIVMGSVISVRMAVEERWYTKSGSKWRTMPQQMLIYRAAAFFQRAYCPEISMGFSTTDEIQDAVVVDEQPAQTRTATLDDIARQAAEAAQQPAVGASVVAPQAASVGANVAAPQPGKQQPSVGAPTGDSVPHTPTRQTAAPRERTLL